MLAGNQEDKQQLVKYKMETTIKQESGTNAYAFEGKAKLAERGAFRYLRYQEREKESGEVTAVTVKIISPEMIQITRTGSLRTRMMFRKGQVMESTVHGFHGVTVLQTIVKHLSVVDQESETIVEIHYELHDAQGELGVYTLRLHYWKEKNQ